MTSSQHHHQFICNDKEQHHHQLDPNDIFRGEQQSFFKNGCVSDKNAIKVSKYVLKSFEELLETKGFQDIQQKEESSSTSKTQLLKHSEIELGRILGQGGFSDVYQVKGFHVEESSSSSTSHRLPASDKVVVKVLRSHVTNRPGLFAACAAGLAREGAILASLSHRNIIQIRAATYGGIQTYSTGRSDSFFIVLDRLEESLDDRIIQWSDMNQKLNHSFTMRSKRRRARKQSTFFRERLNVGADLANALTYLHQNNILHRDIKPGNVGFDAEGTLKLFDFDIAKILPNDSSSNDELFHMSLATGTKRYMSPECALTGRYNLKSDVYSFSILLFEILSLERAYKDIKKSDHNDIVFQMGVRPQPLSDTWPKEIKDILVTSWSEDIKVRPNMSQINERIRDVSDKLLLEQQQTQSTKNQPLSGKRRIFNRISEFNRARTVVPVNLL